MYLCYQDVFTMNNVVRGLNVQASFNEEANTVVVDAQAKLSEEAPYKYEQDALIVA